MGAFTAESRILKQREAAETLQGFQSHVKEQRVFESKAKWEAQSGIKAQWMAERTQRHIATEQHEAELAHRRRELAQKLAAEKAKEVEDLIKQQAARAAQRKADLSERAQQLQAAREREQAATRERLLQQQFAAGCDPLRTEQSKRFLHSVVQGRRAQEEKLKILKQAEAEQDRAFGASIEEDRIKQQTDLEHGRQRAWEKTQQVAGMLSKQVQERLQIAAAEEFNRAREVAAMKAEWAKQEAETKAEEEQRHIRMQQLRNECEEFNRQKLAEAAAAKAAEEAHDLALLEAALRRERQEIAAEQARKASDRRTQQLYKQQLQASMQRQAQDDSAQEAAIELAAKLDAQRRQEDANRRAAARAQLLAEVVQGREQQIALHERLRMEEVCEKTMERSSHEMEAARVEEDRRLAKERELAAQLRYAEELKAQIADKQRRRAKEVSEKLQDQQAAAQQELDIKARIESALSQSAANLPALANNPRHKLDW